MIDHPQQDPPDSYYDAAQQEWRDRILYARNQAKNWQRIALLSLTLFVLFLIAFLIMLDRQKTYVYVAEVRPDEATDLIKLPQTLTANTAEQAYFVGRFLRDIMSLPLDPVVARANWFNAYDAVSGEAVTQLTNYARATSPFAQLGTLTKSIQITNFDRVSDHSIQFEWTVTTYNNQGQIQNQTPYSGIFTLGKGPAAETQDQLLKNPFGLKIVYFSMNNEGAS